MKSLWLRTWDITTKAYTMVVGVGLANSSHFVEIFCIWLVSHVTRVLYSHSFV
jgi:hypothetical protein